MSLVKKGGLYTLEVAELEVNFAENVRTGNTAYEGETFEELKNSIKEEGLKLPIGVQLNKTTGKYKVVHGFRRTKAIRDLVNEGVEIKTVLVQNVSGTEEQILIDHITKNSGLPLTSLELSKIFSKLKKYGYSIEEIAKRTGNKYHKVQQLLAFDEKASFKTKEAVANGELTFTAANVFVSGSFDGGIEEQNNKLNELVENKTSKQVRIKDVVSTTKPKRTPKVKIVEEVLTEIEIDENNITKMLVAIEETFGIETSEEKVKELLLKIVEYGVRI